ncbi:MAG TPA: FtsX-like permease family protein [Methylovirgula sp.]|nr:FtsX-like permease family protein [Methylovirgula sp.]
MSASNLLLAVRLALRDFRGGLSGFWVFLFCLALGLAAIVGVGSTCRALADGLVRQGRIILGGDVSFAVAGREANPQELRFFAREGRLSSIALMRAMAQTRGEAALVEIKAVDPAYPVHGSVGLEPAQDLETALSERDGTYGAAADATLAARLGLEQNAKFKIGSQSFALRAILTSEPDKLAGAVGLGPRVLISEAALRATGLIRPGALVSFVYRLSLAEGVQPEKVAERVRAAFPSGGFEVRTWRDVSPQFSRNVDRFSQFLTLVGLSSLLIGGVGVANAVAGFIERKRETIATLKALGAPGGFAFVIMLIEVLFVASFAMAAGIALGVALPFLLTACLGRLIPFPLAPAIFPREIAAGLVYGLLTTLAFSALPLGRGHDVPVSALFRDDVAPPQVRPKRRYLFLLLASAGALAGSVVLFAADRKLALISIGAAIGGFILLRGAAALIMWGARRLPRPRQVELRIALGNLSRPQALTPAAVLSLGLGLTLVVALALIDGNLHHVFDRSHAPDTPTFFFVGVESAEAQDFRSFIASRERAGKIELVPMLRGRFVALNGRPAEKVKPKGDVAWALEGDRGITFSETIPAGSTLVAGKWWPSRYSGPPLVSMEQEVAEGLGLKLGDIVTVNVLGRNVAARIANLRKVDLRNLGINFLLVYSPNAFAGAPYQEIATLTLPSDATGEATLVREVAKTFPNVVSLRVKDALDAIKAVVDQLALAVRVAASVALVAAVLVLAGALAAGQRTRLHDVVVLKTLGATRSRLLAAFLCEFGIIGLATATFGVLAGGAAALAVVRSVMKLDFVWLWPQALGAAGAAFMAAILLGLAGIWRILGRKPAQYLRNL